MNSTAAAFRWVWFSEERLEIRGKCSERLLDLNIFYGMEWQKEEHCINKLAEYHINHTTSDCVFWFATKKQPLKYWFFVYIKCFIHHWILVDMRLMLSTSGLPVGMVKKKSWSIHWLIFGHGHLPYQLGWLWLVRQIFEPWTVATQNFKFLCTFAAHEWNICIYCATTVSPHFWTGAASSSMNKLTSWMRKSATFDYLHFCWPQMLVGW